MAAVAEDIRPRFTCTLATRPDEIRESQALRYSIFGQEMGAKLKTGKDRLDQDRFDAFCQHLLVRDATGALVASTRLLTSDGAQRAGGFYSEHEFDLRSINKLSGQKLEVGRTCVHPDYRNGATIAVLWSGLARYVQQHQIDYLFGCASIGLRDLNSAYCILQDIEASYLSAPDLRVQPLFNLPERDIAYSKARMPPLLKAYVSLGARACGAAYWDRDFNCADLFMLLNLRELHPRYAKRFMATLSPSP